jgi:CheY-like chemotaxis protein
MTRPRVLVVEDDDAVRDLLKAVAKRCSCEVETAVNGLEALMKMREREVDILLLDLMMPVVSGYDVVAQLRDFKHRPAVIVVTAMTTNRYLDLDPGIVTAVIKKPFDIEALAELLAEVANQIAANRNAGRRPIHEQRPTHVC